MQSTIKQWEHADEYSRSLEEGYRIQRDRLNRPDGSDATPAYRTPCGFTFHFVPGIGWTDGDMTFPTFADMVR